MDKFIILLIIKILFFTNAICATVNCNNGKCEFINSIHYTYAKTHCQQTLNYEDVETDFLHFTISKTKEKCNVFETTK
jgi:uncharacterized protein YpuA (DUF1002 family)